MDFGVWLAAIATIAIYSYLYKDNPLFTLAEHVFVALVAAHTFVTAFFNVRTMAVTPLLQGQLLWIVPLLFGVLLYARFFKNYAVYSRLSIAFLIGVGAALSLVGVIDANLVRQIRSTVLPLNTINNLIIVVGTSVSVMYFFFTAKAAAGPLRTAGRAGRWMLMIALGAAYGNTVMARMSLIIGRFSFLLRDWLGVLN